MERTVNLGPRLECVAGRVPQGALLGDIGTDHGYLPIYLWEGKRIRSAVGIDVHEGPYKSACQGIKSRGLEEVIQIRFGDGLKPLKLGEVDVLTLAGMGGSTMLSIFEARPDIMAEVQHLVLQPQGAEGRVRHTLLERGWRLLWEQYLTDDGRIYVVMHYTRAEGHSYEEIRDLAGEMLERAAQALPEEVRKEFGIEHEPLVHSILEKCIWELGPLALQNPVEEIGALIRDQIVALERSILEMGKSTQPTTRDRMREHQLTILSLEAIKKCLFPLV